MKRKRAKPAFNRPVSHSSVFRRRSQNSICHQGSKKPTARVNTKDFRRCFYEALRNQWIYAAPECLIAVSKRIVRLERRGRPASKHRGGQLPFQNRALNAKTTAPLVTFAI